jgi:hypothetical protein
MIGPSRVRQRSLQFIARLASLPAGVGLIKSFDHTADLAGAQSGNLPSPCGVVLHELSPAKEAALRAMGFGWVSSQAAAPLDAEIPTSLQFEDLVRDARSAKKRGNCLIMNDAATLHGPTIAQRINEVLESDTHKQFVDLRVNWLQPWTWKAWVWALWLGIAMMCAGVGAALITIGPVLLSYDAEFLGVTTQGLDAINPKLVRFLQHDRITMAGCMFAIGANDVGFALAMRRGWLWARTGFLLAGALGFPTFLLFLGYGFFDPLHFAVAIGFFPLYLCGVFGRGVEPTWVAPASVDEAARKRGAVGQLLMVLVSVGVLVSGFVIMVVGLRSVLIPSDVAYMGGEYATFDAALDGRLLRFVAHDRAGFGGALASLGLGMLCTSLWAWRCGVRSTFWSVALASGAGFGAALAVHWSVGYTDTLHLLPVYVGVLVVGTALLLSREWLLAKEATS